MTPDQVKAKGIKDFQLYYALQTLHRTASPAMAKRK
jgi:carboxyl-terminal processing protease